MPVHAQDGTALLVSALDRCPVAEAAIESAGEVPRGFIAHRAAESREVVDGFQQRIGLVVAVAGAENDELDRGVGGVERLPDSVARQQLSSAIGALEKDSRPGSTAPGTGGIRGDAVRLVHG